MAAVAFQLVTDYVSVPLLGHPNNSIIYLAMKHSLILPESRFTPTGIHLLEPRVGKHWGPKKKLVDTSKCRVDG